MVLTPVTISYASNFGLPSAVERLLQVEIQKAKNDPKMQRHKLRLMIGWFGGMAGRCCIVISQ